MRQISNEVNALLKGIIERREKEVGETSTANDDLLGLLMESNYKEMQEHDERKNVGMSNKDVIEECKLFYFAGQETTSVLLLWTMVLLSKHSIWQARAREEVLQVFGNKKPDGDGLNHLKIVSINPVFSLALLGNNMLLVFFLAILRIEKHVLSLYLVSNICFN